MIRHIVDSRPYLSLILTVGIGTLLIQHFPFPDDNAVLQLVAAEKPVIFISISTPTRRCFSLPFRLLDAVLALYILRSTWRSSRAPTTTAIPAGSRPHPEKCRLHSL